MKRIKGIALLLAATFAAGSLAACSSKTPEATFPVEESEVQVPAEVRPQDDFYRYVNGDTLDNAVFGYNATTAASNIDNSVAENEVAGIINDVVAGSGYEPGTEEYIIQNVYNSYLAYDFENAGVPEDILAVFDEIQNVSSVEELLLLDARIIRDYATEFSLLNVTMETNYVRGNERCIAFVQIESIMGADFSALQESYESLDEVKNFVSAAMQAMGYSQDEADVMGQNVGYYVMDIYNATDTSQFQSLMTEENFKLYTRDQIEEILTNVDLNAYYNVFGLDISGVQEFGIYDPGQLQALNDSFVEENLEELKMLELCNFIHTYGQYIYPSYDTLRQYMEESYDTPEEQAINAILSNNVEQTDPLYVERYYTEEMDEALISMCDDIRESYRTLISGADWLSEPTRQGLLQKLDNIIYITAMDLHRTDPSKYAGLECENYYQYTLGLNRIKTQELIDHFFDPMDRGAVMMSMQAMNAAYSPSNNSISITAAIMRAPFFDINADYYANLGGLGMVIAHEMGHAFDSKNINYDANGVFNPLWVGEEDRAALDERDQAAVEYFENNFTIFGVYHVDGERTLGENFADLGGVECISLIPQTNEERRIMYENFARVWCVKVLDTGLVSQLASDVHSPGYIRVMAVLSSIDQFYEAYGITEGDGMYLPPEERISRWY